MKLNEIKQKVGELVGKMPKPAKFKAMKDSAVAKYKVEYEGFTAKILSKYKYEVVKIARHSILSAAFLSLALLLFKAFGWAHYSVLAAFTPLLVVWCLFGLVFSVMLFSGVVNIGIAKTPENQ